RVPDGAPFYGDLVRLADSYGDDEIEAVSRQGAQDQLEITEVVQAYARTGGRAACKVGGAGDSGGSRKGADGGRGAFGELRKQLSADLLKSLVVDHAGVRQHSGTARIDFNADFDSDICRCTRNTR